MFCAEGTTIGLVANQTYMLHQSMALHVHPCLQSTQAVNLMSASAVHIVIDIVVAVNVYTYRIGCNSESVYVCVCQNHNVPKL